MFRAISKEYRPLSSCQAVGRKAEPSGHAGCAYDLTGPEAVSFRDAAATLSQALGREISYAPASIPGYMRRLRSQALPVPQVIVQTILHADMRRGGGSHVTGTLGSLLGRDPRTLADYVRDHIDLWQGAEDEVGQVSDPST